MTTDEREYELINAAHSILEAAKIVRSVRRVSVLPPMNEVALASIQSQLVTIAERTHALSQRIGKED